MSQVGVMSLALRSDDVYTVVDKPVRVSEWENEREQGKMTMKGSHFILFHVLF